MQTILSASVERLRLVRARCLEFRVYAAPGRAMPGPPPKGGTPNCDRADRIVCVTRLLDFILPLGPATCYRFSAASHAGNVRNNNRSSPDCHSQSKMGAGSDCVARRSTCFAKRNFDRGHVRVHCRRNCADRDVNCRLSSLVDHRGTWRATAADRKHA